MCRWAELLFYLSITPMLSHGWYSLLLDATWRPLVACRQLLVARAQMASAACCVLCWAALEVSDPSVGASPEPPEWKDGDERHPSHCNAPLDELLGIGGP